MVDFLIARFFYFFLFQFFKSYEISYIFFYYKIIFSACFYEFIFLAALATTVQMRTVLRYLFHLAAPSSTYFLVVRAYSNGKGSRGPEMFQLEHIRKRIEMTVTVFLNFLLLFLNRNF